MKIGDKVRFLNDVGGGVISGFQGKDIVLVADEDGFEVPTLMKDVVVVETDDYNIAKKMKKSVPAAQAVAGAGPAPTSVKQALAVSDEEEEPEPDVADKEITFRPRAQERRGAEKINLFLGFVPVDVKNVTDTAFEAYLVNDCNYYLHFALFTQEGNASFLHQEGEVAPNTKLFLEEFRRDVLEDWKRMNVQVLAFKRDKSFLPKPPLNVGLRLDITKFYKLHTFHPNDFFNEPSLLCDVIVNDQPVRDLGIDTEKLQQAMRTPQPKERERPARVADTTKKPSDPSDRHAVIEVDLHAGELLDTMVGMQPKDILDYQVKVFRDTMNAHAKESGRKLVFIHGKGDGVLRQTLIKELKHHFPHCRYQDASFREYGYGATMVTI